MQTSDNPTPDLQKAEQEIDNYYKSNPLLKLPFATAAWALLAFSEEFMLKAHSAGVGGQYYGIITDNFINDLNAPMYWLYNSCKKGGQVPFVRDDDVFQSSWTLFNLGQEYRLFGTAYTYASRGWLELEILESTIRPADDFFGDIEYEAYNRLIKPHQSAKALSSIDFGNVLPFNAIQHSLKIQDNRFRYKLNPRMISETMTSLKPTFDTLFSLPGEWQFSRYSLEDFRKVFEVISTIASIHLTARGLAIERGCAARGYADSIYVPTGNELLRRIVRYSGVPDAKVLSIFDDLTYGNSGIKHPDPALQPLIKLNSERYAIAPHLWICSAAERNLTVLLNRLPAEKVIYAKLTNEKENLMRQRLTDALADEGFRFISGRVPNLPDIDLAIIRDSEKACLLLELKWFIEPATVGEIINKSEEIEKGISQLLQLKRAFAENHKPLLGKLEINSNYKLEGTVISDNWIGHAKVQSPEIPIIQIDHLIAKLKAAESLRSAMDWLKDRKYLPKTDQHFKVNNSTATIGRWKLKWCEIEPLIESAFFPL
ncbi:hypothetical protein F4141_18225 [Candidatus Poribacteria bacterium]|nr:hypothetical protein [Candidatus Poribacteria bacterium]